MFSGSTFHLKLVLCGFSVNIGVHWGYPYPKYDIFCKSQGKRLLGNPQENRWKCFFIYFDTWMCIKQYTKSLLISEYQKCLNRVNSKMAAIIEEIVKKYIFADKSVIFYLKTIQPICFSVFKCNFSFGPIVFSMIFI